ncbi:MAG: hypothetical protein HN472_13275 [Nitrospina sp.]|jgi:hypothetical protein|nr:hypothetical protein [Nitrospina sp.]MBT3875735.1 hypothetical protein [Nitrospina sp.]MBT4049182.1 hypothetical protein [Nitrospina sp.]MBT4557151.1 hypothetical protein [Nitrospina sp.]MBT5349760.1 hypothetical protein [Nitrospina sp.]
MKNYSLFISVTTLMLSFLGFALAQETINEKFVNIGQISISNLYSLPEKTNSIVFRIRNNSSRTISHIFGWVYQFDKTTNKVGKNYVLLNNPHKGGNIIKGKPHRPRTVAEWSFPLVREPFIANQEIDYTLRVHPRSIFFANVETAVEPPPNP